VEQPVSAVVRHVCESIGPASRAHAEAARAAVAPAGTPMLERLAAALAGAQHGRPRAAHKTIVVAAGDHGAGDPGIVMNADHPTIVAARAIIDGTGALAQVARAAAAPIVLVDAGAREPAHMPDVAIRLGRGPSRDLLTGPAMTVVDAVLALEAGIALAVSLVEPGLDVLALGAIGLGSELSAAALLAAATGRVPEVAGDPGIAAAGARGAALTASAPLDRLAELGGPDTAVLAGAILGAASMNVAIVLDSYATGAAALAAAALAPAVAGYLVAAHRGSLVHPQILAHLALDPIFEVGLGHGEGTGAAMLLPLIDQVAALASAC
jgi:nicotinate-nucleotide--dimethylbenzimidazole phosphoribosyltransferase